MDRVLGSMEWSVDSRRGIFFRSTRGGGDASNGSVLLAGGRLVTGGWPRRSRWSGRSVMVYNRSRSPRRWRRMSPVRGVVPFLATGRRRWRPVLLFLQQLPKLLNGLVQGPELREQREVQLSKTKHFSPQYSQLSIQSSELSGRWRWPGRRLDRTFTASLTFAGGSSGRRRWLATLASSTAQIESTEAPR